MCSSDSRFARSFHENGKAERHPDATNHMPTITGSWTPETTFLPGAQVGATGQGGHTVLLDYAGGQYYGLDEVGTRIWELVRDGSSLGAIVDRLADEYDAPRDVLQADASALLAELAARRLVRAEG
jgi:hypothetical protein